MATITLTVETEDDWIVCLGETRSIHDRYVACPLRAGRPVPVATCADCHVLTWMHDEREVAPPCTTGPGYLS